MSNTSVRSQNGLTASAYVNLWSPQAGKKFRLYFLRVSFTKESTTPAQELFAVKDGATTFVVQDVSQGVLTAPGVPLIYDFHFHNNGYLSLAADNKLSVGLQNPLSTGVWGCIAWGCEE